MLFGAIAARASDATTIADRAGFLLGHAHRCGVSDARLERSAALIDQLLAAYSVDADDLRSAQSEFAEHIVSGAMAKLLGDPLPACAVVRAQLSRLEQHRLAAAHPGNPGGQRMADKTRAKGRSRPDRSAASAPAKAARPAVTRREEPGPLRRAALALKRAAAELRGRPPSI
jgi:hypothetical protein